MMDDRQSSSGEPGKDRFQVDYKRQAKEKYAFWETQPVAQFSGSSEGDEGPIDALKKVEDVLAEPYSLPESFEWCICNLKEDPVAQEVYELLSNNYVEDDDNMFRFKYSANFLKWCLLCPGHRLEWLVGVRVKTSRKLVGFISAIPALIRVNDNAMPMVEINFLCVHKKLRSKRLAPLLIKEITRRVNKCGIWQAAYTAGVLLPKPLATCRYYHRSLNPRKLIDVGFSRLAPRMTMARTIKLYKLPDTTSIPGLRECRPDDGPQLVELLNSHLGLYKLAPLFTPEEAGHWFQNIADVINTFVVEPPNAPGRITDLVSFYTLPSSILGHAQHTELKAAYLYYVVASSVPLRQLVSDALVLAATRGYDVFNALDLMQNEAFLRDLKFGQGDGQLHYYLYNWRLGGGRSMTPQDVGLVLM
nr:N-myristoyl transferase [Volvox africanus]